MDPEILASRARVSRRRLLTVGGSIGLGTLLAACGDGGGDGVGGQRTVTTPEGTSATIQPSTPSPTTTGPGDVAALLDEARSCALTREATQGPYWFDVDAIRSDITDDRPCTMLALALRVVDARNCDPSGTPAVLDNAVVELWHCDAGGVYSGFAAGGGPPVGGPPGSGAEAGETSDGSYSEGVPEATPTDDETFLRGAQVTGKDGIARFTTIYPGWYSGRTVHIHLKVHVDKRNVLTTQLYFDEDLTDAVYAAAPYASRPNRDVRNDADGIYDASGLLTVRGDGEDGYVGVLNLAVDA